MPEQLNYKDVSNEKARLVVEAFSDFVNGMGHNTAGFVQAVMLEHRTLQQQMFEVMISCMDAWAKTEHFDLRNEYTVKKCRKIMELFPGGTRTPFI